MVTAVSTKPKHPGTIEYFDGNTGALVKRLPVAEVPEALRFAPTDAGEVPVVKVVATVAGDQRTIREYGPDGMVVRSTVQLKGG